MLRLLRFCLYTVFLVLTSAVSKAQLTADFAPSTTDGCAALTVFFTNNSTGTSPGTTWSWNFGNGAPVSSQKDPQTTYANPGTYTVTLTATDGSTVDTATAVITVYGAPTFTFSGTPTGATLCLPLTVSFSSSVSAANGPTPLTYYWDFGDGVGNSTSANPTYTYNSVGPFKVDLIVKNAAGCPGTVSKPGYINSYGPPVADFMADKIDLCNPPETVTFTNTTTGSGPFTNTQWFFGNSNTGTGNTATTTYSTGGPTFNVKMITTDSHGCVDSETKQSYIYLYNVSPSFTISNTSPCANSLVSFTNTTTGATSVSWDFGDGITDAGNSVTHNYVAPGTYTVKLTVGFGTSCQKTTTQTVVVQPNPPITLSYSPAFPCPANKPASNITITASSVSGATFAWDVNGASYTGPVVNHTFPSNGEKTINLTVTNPFTTCTRDTTFFVPVNNLTAEITASIEADCPPLVSSFAVALFGSLPPPPPGGPLPPYPEPAVSWNWSFQNASPNPPGTSNLANPTYTWNSVGTYTITVTGTTANGCDFTATKTVHVDNPVTADFSAAPTVICPKDTVWFTNLSANVANTDYIWDLGDTTFTTNVFKPGFYYVFQNSGTFTVTLKTDHNGCVERLEKQAYITVRPSDAKFSYTLDCPPGRTATFTYTGTGDPNTTYLWSFGDNTTSTQQNPPPHTYAVTGVYTVRLVTYNSVYGCRDTIYKVISVKPPILNATVDNKKICKDGSVVFTGGFTGNTSPTFAWIIGNNPVTPYTGDPQYIHTFNTRGNYPVKMVTISGFNNNCYDTLLLPDTILVAQPMVNYTATPTLGCVPLLVTFNDASTAVPRSSIVTRYLDYGTGSGSIPVTGTTNTNTYLLAGNYTTKLYLIDDVGCQDSQIIVNHIRVRKPFADFSAPKFTICTNEPLLFSNTSTGATGLRYDWDFGDGKRDTARNPTHRWNNPGVYTVTLTVTDSTPCSVVKTMTNYITVNGPNASFTMDDTLAVCPPLLVQFTNTSTDATRYEWDLGQGSGIITAVNPTTTYSIPKKYMIVLKAFDAQGCYSYDTGYAYMLGFNGGFTYTPTEGCAPQTVQFTTVLQDVPTITWDFNDGTGATTTAKNHTVSHTYTTPGTYRPTVIYKDGTCPAGALDSGLVNIRIDRLEANFTTSVPCVGVPFTLTNASTAMFSNSNDWRWFFSATDSARGQTVSHTFNTPGNHSVTMIATSPWGCTSTITKDVYINDLPRIDAGPVDTGICPGDTISLVGRGGVSYTWGPDSLVSCINCDVTRVWKAAPPTWFYVSGIDGNGCINKDSIRTFIQIKTTNSVGPGGEICVGDTFRLQAAGATAYSWEPIAFLDSPNIANPLAKPIITTTYVLTAKEGTCLENKVSVTVVVHPLPKFDAGYDEWINFGSSVQLQPTEKDIARIEWRPDTTLSCLDCFRPIANPSYTTTYWATAYSQFGCVATDSVTVRVRCNGDSVYIPNTFTPNADGKNDVFYPRGKGITYMSSMRIFNRWGELVFERSTPFPLNEEGMGWDGTFKGRQLPPDVYVYTMNSRCPSGEPVTFKGDINLVR